MQRILLGLIASLAIAAAPAGLEATHSVTVQPAGPRAGETGTRFFNIEGKNNEKYAAFGVLDFNLAKAEPDKATGLALSLTQSLARFSKNGKLRVYLSADVKSAPDGLKFQADNGLG